jgi:DNA mismatch endonuclease (patch repair protein)
MGWTVIRLWQHELERDFEGCIGKVIAALKNEYTE